MNGVLVSHINLISKKEHDDLYESVPKNLLQLTLDDDIEMCLLISDEERQKENKQIKEDVKEFLSLQGIQYKKFSIIFYGDKDKLNLNETN